MALLSLQQISLRFGGIAVLDRLSLEVEAGTITALIGPNGAGKTSAFNVITRLYREDAGDVCVAGRSLRHTPPSRVIRHGVARTFQGVELFPSMTALENVLVGAHSRSRLRPRQAVGRAALEALAAVGAGADAHRKVTTLPLVGRKRVELARALVSEPRLLLLDEPAAGLHPREIDALTRVIGDLRRDRGLTVLLIEHDMRVVMDLSDRVHVLGLGALIASGRPDEVQRNPRVIDAYLGGSEFGPAG